MESSRDDFIIAIRSAFLKKGNKQRFSLIGLIFFSVLILILETQNFKVVNYLKISINDVVYRSSFIVSTPEKFLKKTYLQIGNQFNLYNEYINAKSELKKIKEKILIDNFIKHENERLKKVIDDYYIEENQIIAKVLIDKKSPFLKSIVLNKGSKTGIKLGMAVLEGNYLVGKVYEVNYLSSRALLISDLNSKIPIIVEPGGVLSILSGSGRKHGIIQYTLKNHTFSEGDVVYSSGSGNLLKAGIPIGKIEQSNEFKNINVKFFTDFSQLSFVKIVKFKKKNN